MRLATFPLVACALLTAAGCTTLDVLAPTHPDAVNTGRFPSLAQQPVAAARQLPQAEADAAAASLQGEAAAAIAQPRPTGVDARIANARAAGAAAQAGAPRAVDRTDELRRLGETHAEETLRRIEAR